ncbi:hypothetical protein [Acidicapsa acidisoli]|uniref:hypothetical protein n=1 Tax=Acidicapsa acidisoli TaxID=1615681 RepID=UPI0021E022B0|nr:hypothetical protein [Acidicapsa acidisoli]
MKAVQTWAKVKPFLVTVLSGLLAATHALPQTAPSLPSHGTINLLLANKNAMVLITDSRGTKPNGDYEDLEQKLFRLDKKTMVSLAGLVTDPGPNVGNKENALYPMFVATSQLIFAYSKELSKSESVLTFDKKVSDLTEYIRYYLDNLNAARIASEGIASHAPTDLDLIFAGYDVDGTMRSTKRVISYSRAPAEGTSARPRASISSVEDYHNDDLLYLISAPPNAEKAVSDRIAHPDDVLFRDEPPLRAYARAKTQHRLDTLSAAQLKELAEHLRHIADQNGMLPPYPSPVIGGPIQEAVFAGGQPAFAPPVGMNEYPKVFAQNIVMNSNFDDALLPIGLPSAVYIQYSCVGNGTLKGGKILLDNTVIISGHFENCTFFFDGETFYLSSSLQIKGGTLVIGPHLCDQSSALANIRRQLPGLKEVWWSDYPVDPILQSKFWPSGRNHCAE